MSRLTTSDTDWVDVSEALQCAARIEPTRPDKSAQLESIQDRIVRVKADEKDIKTFWNIESSARRADELDRFYDAELEGLEDAPFEDYDQEERVDYVLLRKYLERSQRRLHLEKAKDKESAPLLPFADTLTRLCEARQTVELVSSDAKAVAQALHRARKEVLEIMTNIEADRLHVGKIPAARAANTIEKLLDHLTEFSSFFQSYDPLFDWWVKEPLASLETALKQLVPVIRKRLAGIRPDAPDEIVGDPIGRDGLLVELEAETLAYAPEQLLEIANQKYTWCEKEMKKAASELGFEDNWKKALDHVMDLYDDPGRQTWAIKNLVDEGLGYVKQHDLVTVPPISENMRMYMMPPWRQKVNPFFLGGPSLIVSAPTAEMEYEWKLMSLRGNARHLSKATAFHEMIPGHHLQVHMAKRHRPYRRMFTTPFYVEGWAMYWELVLWERGDFFTKPEERVGTLFWRMHRCARIIFSLKFHLGQLSPQECVDLLVDKVGHERSTAEGEVRRSLNGSYSPLYQAGYFLGALQLWALREEAVGGGHYAEKEFHDRVLKANEMPIEILRALLLDKDLKREYKSKWKFYGDIDVLS